MTGIRRLYVLTAAALFVAAASVLFGANTASANPIFAQTAQQPCSTCHQPGQENNAPNSGFTPTGQAIYNAFSAAGTNCSYNIAKAIGSQLPVNGAPMMPCTFANAAPGPQPSPYSQPAPYPQPSPYTPSAPSPYTPPNTYPPQPAPYSQPVTPTYPQTNTPNFPPTYPNQQPAGPQPYPAGPQPYPAGPQPYQPQPQAYMGPPPWTQSKGSLTKFEPFCIFTGKAYFTLRYNGSETNALHFVLSTGNKVSIEAPSGSKWNSDCNDYPGNGSIWFTTF